MLNFALVEIETTLPIRFVLYTETEIMLIQTEDNMTKVPLNNNIYYNKVSSKPNIDIIGIIVTLWENYNFETIFTSDDILNIQYAAGKIFGFI